MAEATVRFRVEGVHAHGVAWRTLYLCSDGHSEVMAASEDLRITVAKDFAENFKIHDKVDITIRKVQE